MNLETVLSLYEQIEKFAYDYPLGAVVIVVMSISIPLMLLNKNTSKFSKFVSLIVYSLLLLFVYRFHTSEYNNGDYSALTSLDCVSKNYNSSTTISRYYNEKDRVITLTEAFYIHNENEKCLNENN